MFDFLPLLNPGGSSGTAKRLKSFLFGDRVRPRPGCVLHCSLGIEWEHSGVFVARDKIVEVENDDGRKNIRCVDADDFLNSHPVRTGFCIYIACDKWTGAVLGTRKVADHARYAVGRGGEYNLLFDNCHIFTSSCITGNSGNFDSLFTLLEKTISRRLNRSRPITWQVWNHEDDDEPSADGLEERLEEECAEFDHELIEGHEIACDDGVRPALHEELRSWQLQAAEEMRRKFAERFAELEAAEQSLIAGNHGREDILRDLQGYLNAAPETETASYESQLEQRDGDDLVPLRMAVQADWRRSLEHQREEYYRQEISRRRSLLLKELNGRLIAMQEIAAVAGDLGIEPGLLWDQTRGVGARTDLETLKKWADYLKNNAGVRRLCELLGRMRRVSASERVEMLKSMESYHVTIPDTEAPSEIVGIDQGRDISHILPQELALLADPDTEILFDLKFAEGRLMSFDYAGTIRAEYEREHEKAATVVEEDRMGPMIICVDTSGSMCGEPEQAAKAVALALAMKSIEQKRNCYLISFSKDIETRDLSRERVLPELLDFLRMSFHGGTDAAPALRHGMEMMQKENYEKADLLMITDFAMPEITTELKQRMQEARERKCRFYALNIGSVSTGIRHGDFDGEWQYETGNMGIRELNGVVAGMAAF